MCSYYYWNNLANISEVCVSFINPKWKLNQNNKQI